MSQEDTIDLQNNLNAQESLEQQENSTTAIVVALVCALLIPVIIGVFAYRLHVKFKQKQDESQAQSGTANVEVQEGSEK